MIEGTNKQETETDTTKEAVNWLAQLETIVRLQCWLKETMILVWLVTYMEHKWEAHRNPISSELRTTEITQPRTKKH